MATLSGTSLTNCLYIPDFLGSGAITGFQTTTAPTSWTKQIGADFNDCALRVISGSVTAVNINQAFSVVMASREIGTVSGVTAMNSAVTNNPLTGTLTVGQAASSGPAGTSSDLMGAIAHTHPTSIENNSVASPGILTRTGGQTNITHSSTGSNGQHSHTATITFINHAHPYTDSHYHSVSNSSTHSHPSISQDFSVNYIDIILASKD